MITGATLYKQHFFVDPLRLDVLQRTVFDFAAEGGWRLRCWSFFSNHYHLIGEALVESLSLSRLVQGIHSKSAREINRLDSTRGRRIWYEYWDRCLTFSSSFYARLNYVNNNAVHHGLVPVASQYRFCSAGIFESQADAALRRRLLSYRYDHISEVDDFAPVFLEEGTLQR